MPRVNMPIGWTPTPPQHRLRSALLRPPAAASRSARGVVPANANRFARQGRLGAPGPVLLPELLMLQRLEERQATAFATAAAAPPAVVPRVERPAVDAAPEPAVRTLLGW